MSNKYGRREAPGALANDLAGRIRAARLLTRLQEDALGTLTTRAKNEKGRWCKKPYMLTDGQRSSITWLLERVIPRAVKPLDVNLLNQGGCIMVFDDPRQRPEGYKRRPAQKTQE